MQQIEFKGLGKMPVNLTRWFRCSKREQPSRPGVYAVGYEALLQPGGSVIGCGYDHFDGSKWGASATVVTETGGVWGNYRGKPDMIWCGIDAKNPIFNIEFVAPLGA